MVERSQLSFGKPTSHERMNQAALPLEKGGSHVTFSLLISLSVLECPMTWEGSNVPFTDLGLPGAALWVRGAPVLSRAAICKERFHSLANTSPISPLSSFKTLGRMPSLSAIYLYLVCAFLQIRSSASNPHAPTHDEAGNVSNSFRVPPIQCQMFSRSPRRESLQQQDKGFPCIRFSSLFIQRMP